MIAYIFTPPPVTTRTRHRPTVKNEKHCLLIEMQVGNATPLSIFLHILVQNSSLLNVITHKRKQVVYDLKKNKIVAYKSY